MPAADSILDWSKIRAVIFDVDGTLYEQARLRRKMLYSLLGYYARRPWQFDELLILRRFRAEREKRAALPATDLENAQYEWCAEGQRYSVHKVRQVVAQWIFQHPTRYLGSCLFPGTREFFEALTARGVKIGIYSDYPAADKLAALGLRADVVVSSTDPQIDRFKPDPKGLLYVAERLGFAPEECLFIGDRPELDGECARRANMPGLIVDLKSFDNFDFYHNLNKDLTSNTKPINHEPSVSIL